MWFLVSAGLGLVRTHGAFGIAPWPRRRVGQLLARELQRFDHLRRLRRKPLSATPAKPLGCNASHSLPLKTHVLRRPDQADLL